MSPVLQVKECNKVRGHVVLGFDTFTASINRQNLLESSYEKAFHF